MCPGWWQRLHFRDFFVVDPGSEEVVPALLLLASGPWVFPLPLGQGRAVKVPVGKVKRLNLELTPTLKWQETQVVLEGVYGLYFLFSMKDSSMSNRMYLPPYAT